MGNSRFAPVTSDLLARKGDAVPSTLSSKPSLFWRRAVAAPPLSEASHRAAAQDLRRVAPEPAAPAIEPAAQRAAMIAAQDLRHDPAERPKAVAAAPSPVPVIAMPEPHHHAEPEALHLATDALPPVPPDAGKPHKIMVALSQAEYEKLGIAAVKKGLTRHQIVRTALDLHLDRLKREYGGCGCMAMGEGSCSSGGCGH